MNLITWPLTKPTLLEANKKTNNKEEHEFHVSFADNVFLNVFDSALNYKAVDIFKQKEINFSNYQDSVLLIVNVASF